MKRLTVTTLAMALAATTAMAEMHGTNDAAETARGADLADMQGELMRATDLTGAPIYTTDAAADEGWDLDGLNDDIGTDSNQIGEIEDLVLARDGSVRGIIAEVGGFLDIGDKDVMLAMDDLEMITRETGEYAYVTRLNEEELEAVPGVETDFWD